MILLAFGFFVLFGFSFFSMQPYYCGSFSTHIINIYSANVFPCKTPTTMLKSKCYYQVSEPLLSFFVKHHRSGSRLLGEMICKEYLLYLSFVYRNLRTIVLPRDFLHILIR